MQGEATLVAADVERAAARNRIRYPEALRPQLRGGVVGALIEKGSGLLAGVGVVVKDEAIEMKLSGCNGRSWIGKPQRVCAGCGQAFKFTNAGIGALENCRGREILAQDAHACFRNSGGEKAFGEELQNHQVAVFVCDEAGQLVGLAEREAAGVVGCVE